MKTDRFSDIIRRKLESIRPEFSEKDWTRMQASLQTGVPQPATPPSGNPFSGGLWTAKPWLMAAATVSAVVLVGYSFWQHQEINELRQTIGQLHKNQTQQTATTPARPSAMESETTAQTQSIDKPAQPEENQPQREQIESPTITDVKTGQREQRDTVFITRYIAVPSKSHTVPPEETMSAERPRVLPDQRYATNTRKNNSTAQPDQSDNSINNPKTNTYGEPSTSSSAVNENTDNSSITTTKPTSRPILEQKNQNGSIVENRKTKGRRSASTSSYDRQSNTPDNTVVNIESTSTVSTPQSVALNESAATVSYEEMKSIPLTTPSANWNTMLAQRARRMRPARTTVVGGTESIKAPESQPVVRVASHFRVGIGGEVASKLVSAGVFTEVLLGRHWMVGAGLSQASYTGEKFVNDFDFDERTRRDFRKEFARDIDPRRPIANIDTRTVRVQIPVALGYRVSLNRSLTFTPTVGTYLNLSNTENATYLCPVIIPQRGYEEISTPRKRPVDLINNVAFSTGLEWQGGHWVIQGSPVLTMPVTTNQSIADPNWHKSATVGLRARLLYQF